MNAIRLVQAALLGAMALSGCTALSPSATPPPSFYTLELARGGTGRASPAPAGSESAPVLQVLIVRPPHAAAGYDSQRIVYQREAHKLEYFAHSEWVDTPARMLTPLLVSALERSGAFRAVALTPSSAAGDIRLDTEVLRLQHDFTTRPSRVRFTLRATLVDERTRRVLAWREIESEAPAGSDDPAGGVAAANIAVQSALASLAAFCADAAKQVRPAAGAR